MKGRQFRLTIAAVLSLTSSATLAAGTPEQACEGKKSETAGRYFACLTKAERALATGGDTARYDLAVAKCAVKFTDRWAELETEAVGAGGMCPSEGDSGSVQDFLDYCEQSVAQAVGGGTLPTNFATCDGDLTTCEATLGTTEADLASCVSGLGTCNSGLSSAVASLTTCSGNLATATTGTAAVGDVLTSKTFTSTAGLGATGTMPNNGAVTLTPGTTEQAIAAGYHNGAGTVVGDADLVAANIKSGTIIFGVTGTATVGSGTVTNGLLRTGQTISYGPGSDGDLQKGTTQSFTDNGDGTITDVRTGLMWEKKSANGDVHDWTNTYDWSAGTDQMDGSMVATFLAALNAGGGFAGYTDWRIPNRNELLSLVSFESANPSTFPAFNSGCIAGCGVTTCSCTQSDQYYRSVSR